MQLEKPASVALTSLGAMLFASVLAAAPPLSKSEERAKFHPPAKGMEPGPRLDGHARRLEMEKASPLSALAFRSIGPEVMGGRVVDIEIPPKRPDTMLVAYASGGVFRTDNRGGSFTPLFDGESSITLGDVALGDAEGNVIWAGTGENNSSRTSYAGTGVFKSTDAGKTWANVGLRDSHHVGRVVVDARNADTVFVAALGHLYTDGGDRGVYKTTDGGRTWRRTLFVNERTGAIDLAQDPHDPKVLLAAMWERDRKPWNFLESGEGSGLYRSTDAGETWTRLAGGLPSGDTVGRIGISFAKSKAGVVYVVLDNQARRPESETFDEEVPPGELTARRLRNLTDEQLLKVDPHVLDRFLKRSRFPESLKAKDLLAQVKKKEASVQDLVAYLKDANRDLFDVEIAGPEVWRSDDGGAHFRKTHAERLDKVFYSYGYYFARIAVDPADANHAFFGGVPLLETTNGGVSWRGAGNGGVHGDHHVVAFNPADAREVAIGDDGGVDLSFDGGRTWRKLNTVPVAQFTTVTVDEAEPYNVIGGLQDNGTYRGPSTHRPGLDDPDEWKDVYPGWDGGAVVVDPKDPNLLYASGQFGFVARVNLTTKETKDVKPRHGLKEKPLRFNWVTPFVLSPHSREILYLGANEVFRSLDRGETWTAISEDLTQGGTREPGDVPFGTVTSLSESPKKFGVLYAGTDEGKVWATRDGGATWKDVSQGLAKDRWVTRVVASAHDEGTVYATQSGYRNDEFAPYVWKSVDFGATWTSLAKGLPMEPVNVIREDPKAKHVLYLGTDLGAYASLDAGSTWLALGAGDRAQTSGALPHVAVHDLAVHEKTGDLVLGTHGRSVYVAEAAALRALDDAARKEKLKVLPVKDAKWRRTRGYDDEKWEVWNNRPDEVRLSWWSGGPSGPTKIVIKDRYGSVWKELTAATRPGLNALTYDLSAEPKLADAAEAAMRKRLLEKAKAEDEIEKRDGAGALAEDEDDAAETPERPTAAELEKALADPLRRTRVRYLPAGAYRVEVSAGGAKSEAKLKVK